MKIVYDYGERHYDPVTIYEKDDLTNRNVREALSKTLSIVVGKLSPWIWIPDAILGISSSFFETNCAFGNTMQTKIDAAVTTKVVVAKDVDNRFDDYEWYGMASLESCNFKLKVTLNYVDYEDMQPKDISGEARKTIGSEHYSDNNYIQKYVYIYYKGKPGYTSMLLEVVPEPEVEDIG